MQLEKYSLYNNCSLSQLINKPIHCGNGSSSCIYLIFTFNTNLVTDLGVDPTLYKTSS